MIRRPSGQSLEATLRVEPAAQPASTPAAPARAADDSPPGLNAGRSERPHASSDAARMSPRDPGESRGSGDASEYAEAAPDAAAAAATAADARAAPPARATAGDGKRGVPVDPTALVQQPSGSRNAPHIDGRPPEHSAASDRAYGTVLGGSVVRPIGTDANPTAWLPGLSAALVQALPADAFAAELRLRQILGEIDSFTEVVARGAAGRGGTSWLAVLVASLTGAPLLLLDLRKRARRLAPVVGASDRSWSWVIGAARPPPE
jgi:hypothetical protein